jgi:hypothetical protein
MAVSRFVVLVGCFLPGLIAADASVAASRNGFDLDDSLVPAEEILNGGPGRDGIPALDHPQFLNADQAGFLKPDDRVLGLSIKGVNRAYPIRILNYHEIVNDAVDGKPVVITYCPLCGSGMAFSAVVADQPLVFGVSGLLFNSDVLLYDRQTESLWSQIKSVAVTGPMKGTRLNAIPISHTTWRDWQARHPGTKVLSKDTGFRRNYTKNPYPGYRREPKLFFPVAEESRAYRRKSLVMGLEIDDRFKAYPFDELKSGPARFADNFQGQKIQVQYDDKNKTASVIDSQGMEMSTVIAYWFAWYAFHPDTVVYKSR